MLTASHHESSTVPVIKTVALRGEGVSNLMMAITKHSETTQLNNKRAYLLLEKAIRLIQKNRLNDLNQQAMLSDIEMQLSTGQFNLYNWVKQFCR